jgi:predicted permease
MDRTGQRVAWLTMGLTVFVLLIACGNLANLLLARTTARAREYAIRSALGAGRQRLVAQVMTESVLLSLIGGGLGLLLAFWLNDTLGRTIRVGEASGIPVALDLRVLGFALALSAVTGALFGALPAWLAARADVNATLRQSSRSTTADRASHRLRGALIVGQVAMALVLMAGATLFIRGLEQFVERDPGWRPQGVLAGSLGLPAARYPDEAAQRDFALRLQERAQALPGVEHAAVSWSLPIRSFSSSRTFAAEGRPAPPAGQEPLTYAEGVTPGYFKTLGIALLQGREFAVGDTPDTPPVVIVNQTLAQQLWPGENPIGKRIGGSDPADPYWTEVVGVVADVGFPANLAEPDTRYQIYWPLAQAPRGYLTVTLRSAQPPEALAPQLRQVVAALDPDQPIHDLAPAVELSQRTLANFAITGRLLGGFALLGLLLAAVGIYGVVAVFVAQRTPEIGVRIALGAQLRDVLWLVLGRGLRLTLIGSALGLVGATALARTLAAVAPGLAPGDSFAVSAAALVLVLAAAVASFVPAHRATRVDPLVALRTE